MPFESLNPFAVGFSIQPRPISISWHLNGIKVDRPPFFKPFNPFLTRSQSSLQVQNLHFHRAESNSTAGPPSTRAQLVPLTRPQPTPLLHPRAATHVKASLPSSGCGSGLPSRCASSARAHRGPRKCASGARVERRRAGGPAVWRSRQRPALPALRGSRRRRRAFLCLLRM